MKARMLPLVLVAVGVASAWSSTSVAEAKAKDYKSAAALAKALVAAGVRCDHFEKTDELMVEDSGQCDSNGSTLYLSIFKSGKARDDLFKATNGRSTGYNLVGGRWMVQVDDEDVARSLAKALEAKFLGDEPPPPTTRATVPVTKARPTTTLGPRVVKVAIITDTTKAGPEAGTCLGKSVLSGRAFGRGDAISVFDVAADTVVLSGKLELGTYGRERRWCQFTMTINDLERDREYAVKVNGERVAVVPGQDKVTLDLSSD